MFPAIGIALAVIASCPAVSNPHQSSLPLSSQEFVSNNATSYFAASSVENTFNLVFIGDSITQGVLLSDPDGQAPPVVTTKWLQRQFPSLQFYSQNHGRAGHTTVDTLPSTKSDFPEIEEDASQLQQNHQGRLIFSVMLGTNDSAMSGPLGSPVSPENYRENLATIIDRLFEDYPGSVIILHHPLWYSPNTCNSSRYLKEGLKRLQRYFPEIDALIARYGKRNPGQVYLGDVRGFEIVKSQYRTYLFPEEGHRGMFYLHPNKEGAELLGRLWGQAIARALSD